MKKIAHLARNHWDRTIAAAAVLIGFVAIVVAWAKTRQSVFAFEQIPLLISGAIMGMSLIAVGIGFWVSADLRDTWRKLDDLNDTMREKTGTASSETFRLDGRDRVTAGERVRP